MYWEFIEHGNFILPIHHITDEGSCSCGQDDCPPTNAGKHPALDGWQRLNVSWDDEQLEVFEQKRQLEGYGVRLDSLLVIDVDERNGGLSSFAALQGLIPAIAGSGLIVQTGSSSDSRHYYFKLPAGVHGLRTKIDKFSGIDFKSGPGAYVIGPGSVHRSGREYSIIIGSLDEIGDAPADLIELLKQPERLPSSEPSEGGSISHDKIRAMLACLDPNMDYPEWAKVGAAVYSATNGAGFELFDSWSQGSGKKYNAKACKKQWDNSQKFKDIHAGTLAYLAMEAGYKSDEDEFFEQNKALGQALFNRKQQAELPKVDTSQVDLLCPPGFVGRIKDWIDSQCLFPREKLAVMAALTAVGNIAGLHHIDEDGRGTMNLMTLCAAESATGKEAVYQAFGTVMRAAGLAKAMHGSMKSEQEVLRNLLEHQACFYAVDELGEHLARIIKDRNSSNAGYLGGIITAWMSYYTKANGTAIVGGDIKRDMRDELERQVAQFKRLMAANEAGDNADVTLEHLTKRLMSVDDGLVDPFLSVFGVCLPRQLSAIMTEDMATNGLVSRMIIGVEHDDNPRARANFKKTPLPAGLEMAIKALSHSHRNQPFDYRIEHVGARKPVTSTPEAAALLARIYDELHYQAEEIKEKNGLQSIYRRGFEMVKKISMILSADDGVRTPDRVLWAYALVKEDLSLKVMMAFPQVTNSKADALAARVLSLLDYSEGKSLAVIRNKLKMAAEPVMEILEQLIKFNRVRSETSTHRSNKKPVMKFYRVKRN